MAVYAVLCRFLLAICATLSFYVPHAFAGNGTSGDPFTSLADAYSVPSSGRYYFNTGNGLFQADVDNSEGGGWVLVLQYVHQGGTNPALSILGAGSDLPVTSSAALGTDESGVTANWGHAGNAAMSQFTGDIETRWYAETSNHSRVIHFSTSIGDDYFRTGTGSMNGVDSIFTSLTSHTADIPATATAEYSNKADYAMTNFPFYQPGARHWGISGHPNPGLGDAGFRWEVDDFPNNSANDTVHRVWVRDVNTSIEVTNTNDSGVGSLRAAIEAANASAALDDITFAIPNAGPHVISLASALPEITDADVTIDGTTQSGASCGDLWAGTQPTLMVQVDGLNTSTAGIHTSALRR